MQSIRMNFMIFEMIYIITLFLLGSIVNSKDILKLPTNFKPISYRLNVTTHLEYQFMFEGVVDIQMTCIEATDTIVLHSNSLDIDTKSVVVANGGENVVPVGSVAFDPKKELMYVKSTENFKPGDKYVLTIPFRGNLTDESGYYRNSYVDKENNQTRWFAVTQFEPAFARSAFPCFDEPQFKAKFKIILGHKKGLTSVSNMRIINESISPLIPDYVFREFEESVPMSTYLVAYIVMSDFVYIESDSREGEVKFRIITRKDATNQTELAKKIGPLVLKYYEDYFDEKFPLPKQDMVAIPDFNAGAMENWGLVIYRENILLNNLDEDSIEKIEIVAEVIAHELAHQWFGNLVTMKWWSDIWLNEGFATYVGIRGVDFLYPEWNSFQVETLLNFLTILREDSLQSSHPLSVADRNSNEIQEIFDAISYKKGASLLHMMNMFLGENTFKQSVRNYIKKYKFSNADQNDLWSSFTEEAHRQGTLDKNLTVKLIMDTWTLKAGYPILKVVRNYSAETVTLSQERFLRSKSDDIDNNTCWWIPLTMTTSTEANFNQTIPKSWLDCENNNLTIPLAKDNEWVIYNLQMAGLFRILYDTRNWMGIISTLNDPNEYKTIHTLNRVQLIDDSFTFSHNGNLDYGITFQLLNYLKHENEYAPWMTALDGLHFITEIMKRSPNQGVFQNFMRRLLLPVYRRFQNMTSKYNSFEETRFKNLVTAEACRHGIKDCTKQALDLFRKWMKTTDPDKNNILPRELKPVIYCQAIKYGGVDEWDFLWERYQRSNVDSEKEELISTLGCSSETWLLNRYLNWSLDDSIFRTQDTISVFYSVAKRDIGFYVAKDFLYRRWVDISKYFKSLGNIPRKYISIIGFEMKTIQELNEMESFMNKSENNLGGVVQIVGDMNNKPPVFEYIRVNIEGMLEFYHKIVNHIV